MNKHFGLANYLTGTEFDRALVRKIRRVDPTNLGRFVDRKICNRGSEEYPKIRDRTING